MQVGRYRFVDRLAVGGMAEVFVAIAHGSEGFEKPVVIKRLLPQLAENPHFLQMFLDEARIMLNLQHGNIVQILDMGKMDGLPFLALEYVDGRDLRTVLHVAREGESAIPVGLMAHVASEVCRALDYAHRKKDENDQPLNIVHRDVNPANIFLSHEGMVKVGDFGLAKARDNLEQSEAGIIKGKYSYLSPEQAEGAELDHRSDIFSLGTTLYEMTCGVRPFEGETDLDVVMAVREAWFTPPSHVVDDYPSELEDIVTRALEKNPTDRFKTASDMQDALVRFLQKQPTHPGDRQLTRFLIALFGSDRRTQSHLLQLAPMGALPPPMTSVSQGSGLSEFERSTTPTPTPTPTPPPTPTPTAMPTPTPPPTPTPTPTPTAMPPPTPTPAHTPTSSSFPTAEAAPSSETVSHGEGSGPVRIAREPAMPQRDITQSVVTGTVAGERRGRVGIFIVVGIMLLVGVGLAGLLVYRSLNPPTASLNITSVPSNAKVLINGAFLGDRTPTLLTNLSVGEDYHVLLRHPDTEEARRTFRFAEGKQYAFQFQLSYRMETLDLESVPPACDVLVHGELRGQTPISVRLQRGKKHVIQFRRKDYLSKTVHHHADRPKMALKIVLEPEKGKRPGKKRRSGPPAFIGQGSGTLVVATELRGKVYLNGQFVGRIPHYQTKLRSGIYNVLIKVDGSNMRHKAQIRIGANKTYRLTLSSPQ